MANKQLNASRKFERFMWDTNNFPKTSQDTVNEKDSILLGVIRDDFENKKEIFIPANAKKIRK